MAVLVMTNTTLLIGAAWTGAAPGAPGTQTVSGTVTSSTDISIMTVGVSIGFNADEIDYTNFASGGWKLKTSGLKAGTVQLDFNQDYAASQVDALFGLGATVAGFGNTFYLDVKPTSSARGATNPSTVLAVVNTNYNPVAGKVGDLAVVSLTFPFTGLPGRLTS